ncbi:DNA sulfur modification protein DndB [Kitasatospora sp. NPDC017646]|uniref:DNA sulfur modification protein DndB n=1 Tax=Kitasatospora sp. NPDC017646 TaxID=3364024 RepID=UPI003798A19F
MVQSSDYPVLDTSSLPLPGMLLPCLVIDGRRFLIRPTLEEMESFVINPSLTEDPRRREEDYRVRQAYEMRTRAQRMIADNKAKRENVPAYAAYLERGMIKGEDYVTPPMSLVFLDKIIIYRMSEAPNAVTVAHIPPGTKAFHDDGETQYLARLSLRNRHPATGSEPLAVVVDHDRSLGWSSQAFHDLNILGVAVTPAVAIAADGRDSATALAKALAETVPPLVGKVSYNARQVSAGGDAIMTLTTLRRAVAASLIGRKIFALGNRPLAQEMTDGDRNAVTALWSEVFEHLQRHLRHDTVVGLPVVLTAIGIAAHEARGRGQGVGELLQDLSNVNWDKATPDGARRWAGVAGKLTDRGRFSAAGGVKELGHRTLEALTDPGSELYAKIRAIQPQR